MPLTTSIVLELRLILHDRIETEIMTFNCDPTVTCNEGYLGPSLAEVCSGSTFLVFMSLLNTLIKSNDKISGKCHRVEAVEVPDEKYDFVVIGGGAAGPVVAARLSENRRWKVLLLEAGPDEPAGAEVPGFVSSFLGSEIDWQYKTINESHACLSTNGSCSWPAGKNLGGSTVHNGMMYIRGNPTDYNNWAGQGNDGWTWEEVRPFFLLAENNTEIERVGSVHHGTNGPLSVGRFPYAPPIGNRFLDAAEEAGWGVSEDLNGDKITGMTVAQTMSLNGVRKSIASAYLRPVRHRRNLHVSLNSTGTRVIIENDKAVGVEYYKNGEFRTISVIKEVIVTAGAMRSPQILLNSGIGPKDHLGSVGVEVVKDLPGVGENLHNHVSYELSFTVNEVDSYINNLDVADEYYNHQTGPLSSTGLSQMAAILPSSVTTPEYPDLQIFVAGYTANCAPGEVGALQSTELRTVTLSPTFLHTKSRGRVSLASDNPLDYPLLWGNYLAESSDLDSLVESIEIALTLANTEAMRALNFTLSNTPLEACSEHTFASTDYWACAVRQNTKPENHQAGSCKMGPASDPLAVVDPQLRVHGIKGLRVADSSIMPQVTSGNTAAPIVMIGERVAHFIKEYGSA